MNRGVHIIHIPARKQIFMRNMSSYFQKRRTRLDTRTTEKTKWNVDFKKHNYTYLCLVIWDTWDDVPNSELNETQRTNIDLGMRKGVSVMNTV